MVEAHDLNQKQEEYNLSASFLPSLSEDFAGPCVIVAREPAVVFSSPVKMKPRQRVVAGDACVQIGPLRSKNGFQGAIPNSH